MLLKNKPTFVVRRILAGSVFNRNVIRILVWVESVNEIAEHHANVNEFLTCTTVQISIAGIQCLNFSAWPVIW